MNKLMIGTDEVIKIMLGEDEVSSIIIDGETIPFSPPTPPTPPTPVYSAMPFTIEALGSGSFNINNADVDYSLDGGSTGVQQRGQQLSMLVVATQFNSKGIAKQVLQKCFQETHQLHLTYMET
jgi:hypothetical protein